MKKIFALLMAGVLLSFAGAAMGVDVDHPTPTPAPTPDDPAIVVPPPAAENKIEINEQGNTDSLNSAGTTTATTASQPVSETAGENLNAALEDEGNDFSGVSDEALNRGVVSGTGSILTITPTSAANNANAVKENAANGDVTLKTVDVASEVDVVAAVPFEGLTAGTVIDSNNTVQGQSGSLSVAASITKAGDAYFTDVDGVELPNNIVPANGKVVMVTYIEANTKVTLAITTAAANVADSSLVSSFTAMESVSGGTTMVSTFVSADILAAMGLTTSNRFPASVIDGAVTADEDALDEANKVGMGLFNIKNPAAGTYALYVNFSSLYAAQDTASADIETLKLDLSGSYVSSSALAGEAEVAAAGNAKFYNAAGTKVTSTPNGAGYVVFDVENSNYAPVLTEDVKTATRSGSSSSGCDMGVAGLGMIPVAFALAALRRKSR